MTYLRHIFPRLPTPFAHLDGVVIRTNGGTLTIDAPDDDINHYGYAESVNIVEVKSSSYHENGTVPFIQISKGNIVLEETADVNGIHVANVQTYNSSTGEYDKTANTFSHDVVLTLNGADVKLTRDTVGTNLDQAVLVCEVKADSTSDEYIWLYGNGTIEDAKVYVTSTNSTPDTTQPSETGVDNASKAAKAIANNAVVEAGVVTSVSDAGTSAADAQTASLLKGTGTQVDPFLIYDYITMQKISDFYNLGYYYFEVALDKTDNGKIDCKDWVSVNLNGSFDGKGVTFVNLDNKLFSKISGTTLAKVENFDIACEIRGSYVSALCNNVLADHVVIKNVKISGYIEGTDWAAPFVSYAGNYGKAMTLTFDNCYSNATLVATSGRTAGFIAHPGNIGSYDDSRIEIYNSYFDGTMSFPGSLTYNAFSTYMMMNYSQKAIVYFKYDSSFDTSKLNYSFTAGALTDADENGYQRYNQVPVNGNSGILYTKENATIHLATGTMTKDQLEKYSSIVMSDPLSNTASVRFTWTLGFDGIDSTHNWTGTYLDEIVTDRANGSFVSSIKYYDVTLNSSETTKTAECNDGKTFNVVNSYYTGTPTTNKITITEYNSIGAVVRITIINLL